MRRSAPARDSKTADSSRPPREQSHLHPGVKFFSNRRFVTTVVRGLLVLGIALLLWHQFAGLDIGMVMRLLDRVGLSVIVVLLPPLLATLSDSLGLVLCVRRMKPFRGMLEIAPLRVGCDSVILSTPAGIAAGETLRSFWLSRVCKIPFEESVAACLMGKVNMAGSQALFYGLILLLLAILKTGDGRVAALSVNMALLVPVIVVFSVVVSGLGFVYTGSRMTQLLALTKRIPWERWRQLLPRIEARVFRVDATIVELATQGRLRIVGSLAAFLVGWIMLGFESYVILALLGQKVSVGQGLLLEGIASLLRIGFFFLPSAIGAADAAYVSLIAGFGIADSLSVAAAFIAIKRSREILWLIVGYCAIVLSRWTKNSSAAGTRGALGEGK